jgi:hypothetical protein
MRRRGAAAGLLTLAAVAYLATGLVVVAPGEAVVVRRLGRALPRPWGPGLHWGAPRGWDRIDRVRIDEVRNLAVGLVGVPGPDDEPGAGEFLTGDRNLLRARGVVQYRVADPVAFVLRAEDVEGLLARQAEASLARALARRGIDAVLRAERAEVARDAEADWPDRSPEPISACDPGREPDRRDAPGRGPARLRRRAVGPERARPPAHRGRDVRGHDPGDGRRLGRGADGAGPRPGRSRRHAGPRPRRPLPRPAGEADRARPLTVRRLYRDALRDLLPKVRRKLVLTPEEPVDLSILGREE